MNRVCGRGEKREKRRRGAERNGGERREKRSRQKWG